MTGPLTPEPSSQSSVGQQSPDGRWWWDGTQWQPVESPTMPTEPAQRAVGKLRLKRPLLWFVAGIVDVSVFPLLVPWVFFGFGLIQGVRRFREGGGTRASVGIAVNVVGLVAYLAISVGLAIAKGDGAYVVTYLLESPRELRLFNYLPG
jgi:hypothetical protein